MSVTFQEDYLLALLLAIVRAGAWIAICPPFSHRAIPVTVKGGLAIAIALPMAQADTGELPAANVGSLMIAILAQVAVGLSLGLITLIALSALQAAGDFIDLFGNFSIAQAYDPATMSMTAVFGKFYGMLMAILIFASGGHLLLLRGFLMSYELVPLNGLPEVSGFADMVVRLAGGMFFAALQIAAPVVAAAFLADIALGLLTRTAPSLNIFSLGFPMKIGLTLVMVGMSLALLPGAVDSLVDTSVGGMLELAGG